MPLSIKPRIRSIIFWGLLVALAACEGTKDGCLARVTGPDLQQPRVIVTPSVTAAQLAPGTSLRVRVGVRLVSITEANLSIGGSLPTGVRASFSPPTVTDHDQATTLILVADSTASPGPFVHDVIATGEALGNQYTGTATMTNEVLVPFTLGTPTPQVATVGTTREIIIAVGRNPFFEEPVGLSVDPATLPAGTIVSFEPPTATGYQATLRLAIPANAPTLIHNVRVLGRYGASQRSVVFPLSLQSAPVPPDFTVVATPATATVAPGESAAFTLTYARNETALGMGSYLQSVSGLPPGATVTFTPNVPLTSSQMVIQTTSVTPDGSYPLIVTATLGALIKTTSVNLIVATPANFTLAVTPASVTVALSANTDVALAVQRTGPKDDIAIDAPSVPAGVLVTSTPSMLNTSTSAAVVKVTVGPTAVPGTYPITVRGLSGSLSKTATLTLTVPAPPPSDVAITVVTPTTTMTSGGTTQIPIRLTRSVSAVGALLELRSVGALSGGNAWITPSSTTGDDATLNVIGGAAGAYSVVVSVIRGSIPPTDIATINVTPSTTADFSILPVPQTLEVQSGMFASAIVQIGRTNGFAGAVSFVAITDRPSDYQVTFAAPATTANSMSMTVNAGTSVPLGPHVMRVRATSGNITHEVSMTINVIEAVTTPNPYPYPYGMKRPPPP